MKNTSFIFSLLFLLILNSCTKVGPTGPVGPAGRNGQAGADGANGQTSKVYYFDITLNKFVYQSYNEAWSTYAFINGITINPTDMVMAFVNLSTDGNGDNYWQAMPYNEYLNNTQFFIQHSFGIMGINDDSGNNNYQKGDIMFSLRASDGLAPYNDMASTTGLLRYNVYVLKGVEGKKAILPYSVNPKIKSEVEQYINSIN